MGKLDGRVSIVTGGGAGIGRSMCMNLAAEGSKVVVADMNLKDADETVRLIDENGGEASSVEVNVTNVEQIENMVDTVITRYGSIDVLCNNAGIAGSGDKTADVSDDSWDKVLNVDIKSIFLVTKRVLPQMLKQGKGVVINTSSICGIVGSTAGIEYTVAKHGVIGFTKQIAFEYGHDGIRSVSVAPGLIETPQTIALGEAAPGDYFYEQTMKAPAGRFGYPDDIGKVVAFLASDDAGFMTGNTVVVDGGFTTV